MSLNLDTMTAVCCYEGDAHRVQFARSYYEHHETPVVILSPADSPVVLEGFECRSMGQRAYIGQTSLDRQRMYLEFLSTFPYNYFLVNDADSFCLSAKLPQEIYDRADATLFSNEVTEPRPHASPYPKLAFQPPYFFSRLVLKQLLSVAGKITAHPITPYVDWFMLALCYEAGLNHASFASLEHEPRTKELYSGTDPWETLAYRIKFCGAAFMHPIKTPEQVSLCVRARMFYEQRKI